MQLQFCSDEANFKKKTDFLNSREIFNKISYIFSLRSSSDFNEHPFSFPLIYLNRQKPDGTKSGE